nr:ComEA family DNA-binding protein [uncultured Psychrobacter sp.]
MSAVNKYATYNSSLILCLLLIGCIISALPAQVHAAPCFDDPASAYQYLLAQEKSAVKAREQKRVNINRASEGELTSLNGIGSSKAQAIILYREMFGDFKSVDELQKVKGIGAKTVEKNRSRLQISE